MDLFTLPLYVLFWSLKVLDLIDFSSSCLFFTICSVFNLRKTDTLFNKFDCAKSDCCVSKMQGCSVAWKITLLGNHNSSWNVSLVEDEFLTFNNFSGHFYPKYIIIIFFIRHHLSDSWSVITLAWLPSFSVTFFFFIYMSGLSPKPSDKCKTLNKW